MPIGSAMHSAMIIAMKPRLERHRQPCGEQLAHRRVLPERAAEIAVKKDAAGSSENIAATSADRGPERRDELVTRELAAPTSF